MPNQQLEAVKLLLKYGARPDARDVCGKTVCHYGMGACANVMSLKAGGYCIAAHASSHLFGQEVELCDLQKTEMNGLRGICRGYDVDTGRRTVYLFDHKKAMAIKPDNLQLVDEVEFTVNAEGDRPKLCDIQDRLGGIALTETLFGDKSDVAKVLLEDYNARIDLKDAKGNSPKVLAFQMGTKLMAPTVAAMIRKVAVDQDRAEAFKRKHSCSKCTKAGVTLMECTKCHSVQYCCKECQVWHWKSGGHKAECSTLGDLQRLC